MRGGLRCRGGSRYRLYRLRRAIMARRMDLYTLIKQIYVKPIVLVRIPNSQCRTHFLISERAEESCRAVCSARVQWERGVEQKIPTETWNVKRERGERSLGNFASSHFFYLFFFRRDARCTRCTIGRPLWIITDTDLHTVTRGKVRFPSFLRSAEGKER